MLEGFTINNGRPNDPVIGEEDRLNRGGGVFISNGASPTLRSNVIRYNFAVQGAGIYIGPGSSPVLFDNDIFDNCQFDSAPSVCQPWNYNGSWTSYAPLPIVRGGGGIYVAPGGSILSATGNTLQTNGAQSGGAGAYFDSAAIVFGIQSPGNGEENIFRDNIVGLSGTSGKGGGIYITGSGSGTVLTQGTDFISNTATGAYGDGGAIYMYDDEGTTISNCSFEGNTAQRYGGAIRSYYSNYCSISSNLFDNNDASYGGGIKVSTSSCTMSTNFFYQNSASLDGGAVQLYGSHSAWTASTISSNTFFVNDAARRGGAIAASSATDLDVYSNGFYMNTSTQHGAGLYATSSSGLDVFGGTFYNNNAALSGGGIYLIGGSSQTIDSVLFSSNTSGKRGGGVALNGTSSTEISGCSMTENYATYAGGGAHVGGSTGSISETTLESNGSRDGGGIAFVDCPGTWNEVHLDSNLIRENSASGTGGGIFVDGSDLGITNNVVCLNTAQAAADAVQGLLVGPDSHPRVTNNTFLNDASDGLGAGIAIGFSGASSDGDVVNNIIVRAHDWGIARVDGNGTVLNSHNLFWDVVHAYDQSFQTVFPLTADPLLSGGSVGCEHMIQLGSPARDNGLSLGEPSLPDDDYFGTARPQGAQYDRGAHEIVAQAAAGPAAAQGLAADGVGAEPCFALRQAAGMPFEAAREAAGELLEQLVGEGVCAAE